VEQVASLEAMPNLLVLRPGDAEETVRAWQLAVERTEGPTAIILTRQTLGVYKKYDDNWNATISRGAYIVREPQRTPDVVLVASGSEVGTALHAADKLTDQSVRVVSMPSRELFLEQPRDFREKMIPSDAQLIIINAGVAQGWERLYVEDPPIVSVERFGLSGPGEEVAEAVGVGPESALRRVKEYLDKK
jgi:transketolase